MNKSGKALHPMAMMKLRRAEKKGRRFQNPVETKVGGLSVMLQADTDVFDESGGTGSAGAAGAVSDRSAGVSDVAAEWAAGDVDGARVDADGDRWGAGADGPGVGGAGVAVFVDGAEAVFRCSAAAGGAAADRRGAGVARPL